jgi:hypothetical protein
VGAVRDVSDALGRAALDEGCTAARTHVGAALHTSAALGHAEPMRPPSNTSLLVLTWAPRSTAPSRSATLTKNDPGVLGRNDPVT